MIKGHLHQEKQHLQITKQSDINMYMKNIQRNITRFKSKMTKNDNFKDTLEKDIKADVFPASPSLNVKTNGVIYLLIESSPTGMGYIDLTERFPYRSAKGNQYLLVTYHFDVNTIYAEPIKNRESKPSPQRGRLLTVNLNKQECNLTPIS